MSGWYSTGTVAVTNGSATVTGSGTAWTANVRQGWGFQGPDGRAYQVLAVVSDTQITLARNYAGSTLAGQQYDLFPTQGEVRDLAAQAAALVAAVGAMVSGAGAGKFSAGTAALPGVAASTDLDTGIAWLAANVLGISTGGVERMRITSSGSVGVGMTPTYMLDVAGDAGLDGNLSFGVDDCRIRLETADGADNQRLSIMAANAVGSNRSAFMQLYGNDHASSPGVLLLGSGDAGSVRVSTAGIERARWDNLGNMIFLSVTATPPALTASSQMVFNLTSNTNLRVSVRGTDGTTRVADLTLA